MEKAEMTVTHLRASYFDQWQHKNAEIDNINPHPNWVFPLVTRRRFTDTDKSWWNSTGIPNYAQSNSPSEFPMRETQNTMMYATMRTHSYCLGCKYSLQMYLRSSSSSSAAECRFNSVVLETCAGDKHSSQSKFLVTPDILSKCLFFSYRAACVCSVFE